MSALEQAWSVLKNDYYAPNFRKRPILGNRILTPAGDEADEEELRARRERYEAEREARIKREGGRTVPAKETDIFRKRPILGNRILTPISDREPTSRSFSQRVTGDNNTQISAGGNVRTNLPQEPSPEPSPMDLAMEEIRAAQKQREEQAALFEQMMGGAFRDATGRMVTGISQEARDMIAMLMAQGIPADQAKDITRQQIH